MKKIENKYIFLLDVDGTLSTGEYIYDEKGKNIRYLVLTILTPLNS